MTQAMLALLLQIEWQGDDVHYICPSCRASQMHGHQRKCALQAMLTNLMADRRSPHVQARTPVGDHEDGA